MKVKKSNNKYISNYGTVEFSPFFFGFNKYYDIVINNKPTDMYTTKISTKLAVFYMRIFLAEQEGKDKYYYVDRNTDPVIIDN